MSRRAKGPRLWWRNARYDSAGRLTHDGAWFILDGSIQRGTGCGLEQLGEAEEALAAYIAKERTKSISAGSRGLSVPGSRSASPAVADLISLAEAAKLIRGADVNTLRRHARAGRLNVYRVVGKSYSTTLADLGNSLRRVASYQSSQLRCPETRDDSVERLSHEPTSFFELEALQPGVGCDPGEPA